MGKRDRETLRLKKRTASRFGFEWERFSDIFAEYEANFLSYINPIDKEFFKGKLVLDAGCGAGRHTYFAAEYGAEVVAFDLSGKAVESAIKNTQGLNVKIMQGDIYNPPRVAWNGKFDFVMCIGVLHHLPDPQEGFNRLVSLLKLGGTISIWVYGRKDNKMALYIYEPLRKVTTKIPNKVLYYLAYIPAIIVDLCNRLRLPLFRYYARFPFKTKLNDSFDVLSAPLARYYTIEDIQEWFRKANLKDIKVSYRMLDGVAKGVKGVGVK